MSILDFLTYDGNFWFISSFICFPFMKFDIVQNFVFGRFSFMYQYLVYYT